MTTSERPMKFKDFLGGALYGWCGEYRRGWNDALDAEREWSSQTSPPTPHGEAVLKAAHAIRLAQGAALAIGASEEMQAAFLQRCADVISKYGDTLLTLIEGCEVRSSTPPRPPKRASRWGTTRAGRYENRKKVLLAESVAIAFKRWAGGLRRYRL